MMGEHPGGNRDGRAVHGQGGEEELSMGARGGHA
jgi:hypothetical protein